VRGATLTARLPNYAAAERRGCQTARLPTIAAADREADATAGRRRAQWAPALFALRGRAVRQPRRLAAA